MIAEFSRRYDVAKLAASGREETLKAKKEELSALAGRTGLPAVKSFKGSFICRAAAPGTIGLQGKFDGKVIQTCSRSGKDFEARVREAFETLFITPAVFEKMAESEIEALEDYELMEDDRPDIGELFTQYFILALDPYPVLKGDISEKIATSGIKVLSEAEAKQGQSPFSKLKELQRKT